MPVDSCWATTPRAPSRIMRADWIADRLPQAGRVLDVGFAGEKSAAVHERLRDRAGQVKLYGIDLNVARLSALGLPLTLGGDVSALPFADETFSAVIAAELLEHLESPDSVLPEFARVLQPGGRLLITTPNPYELVRWLRHWVFAADLPSHQNVRRFLGNPDHEGFVEPISFCRALRRNNLDTVELRTMKLHLPLLGKVLRKPVILTGNFFPANRLGAYLCIAAVKRTPR
jgi:SAM-dependent methyltransferase